MLKRIFKRDKNNVKLPDERSKQDVPEGIMQKCEKCSQILYHKELEKCLHVCPNCGHHHPIGAQYRISCLLDENSFVEWDSNLQTTNPLNFPEYMEKVEQDKQKTKLNEAILTGKGTIDTNPVAISVMDARFRMGSMGSVVGEKIARAIERAREQSLPYIIFTASGGARMQEGVLSLMQMAKTSVAIERFSRDGGLMISVLTHPTTGGVTASFASLGDYNIAEPGALIGFAGRRVIEQTTREKLPDDFQTAEFLFKHGQLDKIVHRHDMRATLSTILSLHRDQAIHSGSSTTKVISMEGGQSG